MSRSVKIFNSLRCLLILVFIFANVNGYNLSEENADLQSHRLAQSVDSIEPTAGYPYLIGIAPDEETIRMKAPPNADVLAEAAGYSIESYKTTTSDGYILIIHRLVKEEKTASRKNKPVVLLQHGISQSSGDWLINDSGKSLAMILVDNGYDVWLGNSRGNKYSNSHLHFQKDTMEFYNFTFHEMGVYDFPATVDLILKQTGESQISYVGCSLGVTLFFTAMSAHPQYASKIRFMAALSPQVFLSHTRTPIKILAPHLPEIKEAAIDLHVMRINPETLPAMINSQLGKLCFWRKLSRSLCNSIYKMLDEFDLRRIEEDHLDALWKYIPTTTSARTCIHLLQLMNNQDDQFDQYDYGPDANTKVYGSPAPPEYDLSNVKVPVVIFTGKEELFSTYEDVEALKRALPYIVQNIEVDSTFRVHTDFTHEKKAVDQIFKPIIFFLNHYSKQMRNTSSNKNQSFR